MAKVQLTGKCNIFAIGQQHTKQPEIINEGRVDQSSRNSSKNMPRFSSNDMVHNHYLDEAKKKTQERDRNSKPSVMTPARFQSTTADGKPKPRSTNHSSRSLPMSKSSCGNPQVEFSNLLVLGGFLQESYSTLTQARLKVNPHMVPMYLMECQQGKSQSMATAKADISETIVKVFNKRTRVIMESIHVNFDELPLMASDQNSSDPAPECQTMASDQNSSEPAPKCQTMASDQKVLIPHLYVRQRHLIMTV
nr:hypothetical protein [Tanacetum cinerariifolium]